MDVYELFLPWYLGRGESKYNLSFLSRGTKAITVIFAIAGRYFLMNNSPMYKLLKTNGRKF
jgi:hypothetical protein